MLETYFRKSFAANVICTKYTLAVHFITSLFFLIAENDGCNF